jgi:hypothetical protein
MIKLYIDTNKYELVKGDWIRYTRTEVYVDSNIENGSRNI